ncbi:MAG: cytochrome C [Desulfuromonadaceae bacterium]|nr:cytochrome C [Desulfuromonadaceae bacterium]MDD2849985.1 cytochrome C [Desulfuromonadaceae bacterium]MDD4129992.1 cytochrome C [Desulfuromonadaceae bacterium]
MQMRRLIMTMFCLLPAAALMYGCGSSSKTGDSLSSVATVGDTACIQCHSAVVDPLTGVGKIAQYEASSPHKDSAHANNGNGCEACHGNGGQHNGVGPIAYVNPYDGNGTRCADCHKGNYATNAPTKFADSKHANVVIEEGASCRRCHSHEGAVLGSFYGLTGTKATMDNALYQGAVPLAKEYTQFKCQTCHEHGGGLRVVKGRDPVTGAVVNWNPSKTNLQNDQFNLCTSCHNLLTADGATTMASGNTVTYDGGTTLATVAVGHHEDSWFRVIATTHANNSDNTLNGISGYVIRKSGESACFDCHAHEAKTNTNSTNANINTAALASSTRAALYDPANETVYTEWAKSGHAGRLLEAKHNSAFAVAARSTAVVDGMMKTSVNDATAAAWNHYAWNDTVNATAQNSRGTCQRCHTPTGASNYLKSPATYDYTLNDFSHLAGWKMATSTAPTTSSKQRDVLYCWGCHSNSGSGVIRNPGAITAEYNFKGTPAVFPDVAQSNLCVACHSGLAGGETVTALTDAEMNNVSFKNSHYMAAAGLMYVKNGFTAFIDPSTAIGTSTYGASMTSTEDGGALSSTHRKLGTAAMATDSHVGGQGLVSGGPCITCHMSEKHHTLEMDASAFNNTCVKCHDEEGGVPLTAANFKTIFIEEQAVPFQDALTLALSVLKTNYNISYNQAAYPYFFDDALLPTVGAVKDWTRGGTLSAAEAKKLMGACFNINVLMRDPAAYVHARTYTRRLLYDSIDFLDNKTIDMSTVTTAVATFPLVYVKGATATDVTTTEAVKYLAGYSRSTGAWNALERP